MLTIPDWSEFAWAVGLFEGEGCISIYWSKDDRLVQILLRVGMKDEDVVHRFHAAVGIGKVAVLRLQNEKHSRLFGWSGRKREEVVTLLQLMLPYLGARRKAKAIEAIEAHAQHPIRPRGRKLGSKNNVDHLLEDDLPTCRAVVNDIPCPRKARRRTGLCRACYMRQYRGGFLSLVCKPWQRQRLLKATRRAAQERFV